MDNESDKPLKEIEDFNSSLHLVHSRIGALSSLFVELGHDHINKMVGHMLGSKEVFKLRDTILYRVEALVYHYQIMLESYVADLDRIGAPRPVGSPPMDLIIADQSARSQFALFDSVMFHSVSLFDYFGNLIDYMCAGSKQKRLKWNGAVRSARDRTNPLSASPVAKTLVDLHKEWLDSLYKLRSAVIHNKAHVGGRTLRYSLGSKQYDHTVYAPQKFIASFKELKTLSHTHDITLHWASEWLILKTLESSNRLIKSIQDHLELNRSVPPGQEVITIAPPK